MDDDLYSLIYKCLRFSKAIFGCLQNSIHTLIAFSFITKKRIFDEALCAAAGAYFGLGSHHCGAGKDITRR